MRRIAAGACGLAFLVLAAALVRLGSLERGGNAHADLELAGGIPATLHLPQPGENRSAFFPGRGRSDQLVEEFSAAVDFLRASPHVDGARLAEDATRAGATPGDPAQGASVRAVEIPDHDHATILWSKLAALEIVKIGDGL